MKAPMYDSSLETTGKVSYDLAYKFTFNSILKLNVSYLVFGFLLF